MGIGKVIFIPILIFMLVVGTVYFTAFSLESTDEARVTEMSHSLEANFNEIVRQTLIKYLSKEKMREGYLYIEDTDKGKLEKELTSRLKEYIMDNYMHNEELYLNMGNNLIPAGKSVHHIVDDGSHLNGLTNFNANIVINQGTNPFGSTNVASYSGTSVGVAGKMYGKQYSKDGKVKQSSFPSVSIYSNKPITLTSNRNGVDKTITLNPDDPSGDKMLVGYFTSFIKNTGGTNLYPVRFKCYASAESYSDPDMPITGEKEYQTGKDNRARYASVAYTIKPTDTPSTNVYNDNKSGAKSNTTISTSAKEVNFDKQFANKGTMNSPGGGGGAGGTGGGFAVGLDIDKNATINSEGNIESTQTGDKNKAKNAYKNYSGTVW